MPDSQFLIQKQDNFDTNAENEPPSYINSIALFLSILIFKQLTWSKHSQQFLSPNWQECRTRISLNEITMAAVLNHNENFLKTAVK